MEKTVKMNRYVGTYKTVVLGVAQILLSVCLLELRPEWGSREVQALRSTLPLSLALHAKVLALTDSLTLIKTS